jgi:hypothetical protein
MTIVISNPIRQINHVIKHAEAAWMKHVAHEGCKRWQIVDVDVASWSAHMSENQSTWNGDGAVNQHWVKHIDYYQECCDVVIRVSWGLAPADLRV